MSNNPNYDPKVNDQKSEDINDQRSIMKLLPIVFVLAIIPLIVRGRTYNKNLSRFSWYSDNDMGGDLFLYYKSFFFVIITIVVACTLVYLIINKKGEIKGAKIFIPLAGYALMAIASTILSQYRYFGVHGIADQFESLFVLLGYCLITYYAFLVVNTMTEIQFIMKWWVIGISAMCLIGLFQFLGKDIYLTKLGMGIIAPGIKDFTRTFEANHVYMSLYNPNYVGVFGMLVIPVIIALLIWSERWKHRIMYMCILAGVFISLYGSRSKSSIIALAIVFLVAVVLSRKLLLRYIKVTIPIIAVGIIAFAMVNIKSDISLVNRVNRLAYSEKIVYNLTEIRTNEDNVQFDYKGNTLVTYLDMDNEDIGEIIVVDQSGETVKTHSEIDEESEYSFMVVDDKRFAGITMELISFREAIGFSVSIEGKEWVFSNQTGKTGYYYLNYMNKWDKIEKSESAIFTDYPTLASGRGYLWAKTLPVMKKNILLGSGADTFTVVFPQRDYVDNYNAGYGSNVMTKPHNLYMQIGVQTGGISLVCFLVFCFWYIFSSFRLYDRCSYRWSLEFLGAGIMLAVIGYMVMGLSNDSTITCAPIFWTLIGIGISINKIVKETQMTY